MGNPNCLQYLTCHTGVIDLTGRPSLMDQPNNELIYSQTTIIQLLLQIIVIWLFVSKTDRIA